MSSIAPNYDAYGTEPVELAETWAEQDLWKPRDKSAFIVRSDNPYSESIADGLVETFKEKGWKIAGEEKVPFGPVNDWGTIIAKIRSANPDFIVNTDYQVSNEASFMQQFLQNPTQSLVFMQYGPNQPQFFELTKDKARRAVRRPRRPGARGELRTPPRSCRRTGRPRTGPRTSTRRA